MRARVRGIDALDTLTQGQIERAKDYPSMRYISRLDS